jgi:Glycosyl hydrolase family 26
MRIAVAVRIAAAARRKAPVFALAVALSGCAAPLTWTQPAHPAAPPPSLAVPVGHPASSGSASVSTSSGLLTGAYESTTPTNWSGMAEFGAATGLKPRIALYYSAWNSGFNASFAQTAHSHGAYVFAQLQPNGVTLADVAAGKYDKYLRQYAYSVRVFGYPVILSFAHEMNGNWYTWGYGHTSPADFIAAWRHVVDVFREEGASNVTWVWTVNATNTGATDPLKEWWPGASYVNWVGIDGYYYSDTDSFNSVFGTSIDQIRAFSNAPVIISETAIGAGNPSRESQIAALFSGIRADHIVGVVWFDKSQNDGLYHQNWRLETDPAALEAFKQAARG